MIPGDRVSDFVNDHRDIIEKLKPSFFEMTVAMAFDHFHREKVDIAIIEVGMGGRLDSTNIIHPLFSIITNIGMDHSQFLGDSLYKIATEKAGIIKPGVPLIIGETQEEVSIVFKKKAQELNCELYFADQDFKVEYALQSTIEKQLIQVYRSDAPWGDSLEVDLMGMYQQKNIISVLKGVELFHEAGYAVSEKDLRLGLRNIGSLTGLRGRWEILGRNPRIICDTAHNADGIKEVVNQLNQTPYKNLHIVLGMVNDKDPGRILSFMPSEARYYFTQAVIPRAMDREELATEALKFGLYGRIYTSPRKALQTAKSMAEPDDLIFIGGSTFIVAEIL
jgi:dihydrofolate synthase/folylpolyglutamate synthase